MQVNTFSGTSIFNMRSSGNTFVDEIAFKQNMFFYKKLFSCYLGDNSKMFWANLADFSRETVKSVCR